MAECLEHWATCGSCSMCGKLPEHTPLYHCPFHHQYCNKCYQQLRKNYRGSIPNGCVCEICKTSAQFRKTKIPNDPPSKLKVTPGIGRPFRYQTNPLSQQVEEPKHESNLKTNFESLTPEQLLGLPKMQWNKLLYKPSHCGDIENSEITGIQNSSQTSINGDLKCSESQKSIKTIRSASSQSKKPIVCPHAPCKKVVAISSFFNHFKYEHADIPRFGVERGKDLILPFDLKVVEHGKSICLSLITVYEIIKPPTSKSRSNYSVVRACNKFCQKVPIDTFWLMVSGSKTRDKTNSFLALWLFVNSEEVHKCTIELSSQGENISVSTFCYVNGIREKIDINEVVRGLNCLYLCYGSVLGILQEGSKLNLRITVH